MKTQTLTLNILLSLTLLVPSVSRPQEPRDIVIAIIDTGIDMNHPMFRDHLWTNPQEINNGKDNDGNGFAGDFHGWNFSSQTGDINDEHGHGTHIAGIILRKADSPRIKFMILKYYDPNKSGEANLQSSIEAIRYATKMKADIINYSGGGDVRSPLEEAAIRDAQKQGIVFVAAAGNEGRNTDRDGYFPAGYRLSNIISVAAVDADQKLLESSNFGSESVDIAAPGKNILSALPGGRFGFMSGTSQATAWVTGLVASLLLQSEKTLNPEQIKNALLKNATRDSLLAKKIRSEARISSLQLAQLTP